MEYNSISVIVCTRNRPWDMVNSCLNQIKKNNDFNFELILVDNNDDPIFCELSSNMGLIYIHEKRKGISFARNAGIKTCKGDYVFFTDDDVLVGKNWIKKTLDVFSKDPEVSVVGGVDLTPEDSSYMQKIIGLYKDYRDIPKSQFGLAFRLDSSNITYKKEVLLKTGGFDINLNRTVEVDLNLRVHKFGYKFAFDPNIIVYHTRRDSIINNWRQYFGWGYYNYKIFKKHPKLFIRSIQMLPSIVMVGFLLSGLLALNNITRVPFLLFLFMSIGYVCIKVIKIILDKVNIVYVPGLLLIIPMNYVALAMGFFKSMLDNLYNSVFVQ